MTSDAVRAALVRRVDLVQVVGAAIPLEASGRCYRGFCPRHEDATASLYVDPERREFACISCGVRGGAVDFVMEYEGVDDDEAVRRLAERLGVDRDGLAGDGSGADVAAGGGPAEASPVAQSSAIPGSPAGLSPEHALAMAAMLGVPLEKLLAVMAATAPVASTTASPAATAALAATPSSPETPAASVPAFVTPSRASATEPTEPCAADATVPAASTRVAPGQRAPTPARPVEREGRDDVARILSEDNLFLAWQKHRAFAQAHDVYFDSQMFKLYDRHAEENLYVLRARLLHLVDGGDFYAPAPLRMMRLTKPKGGVRDIAILAQVEDGIVIQAILNVLGPRIEKSFSANSYGHRLAHDYARREHVFERWQELWGRYRKKLQRFLWSPSDHAYLKGDLTAFYDRVDRRRMRELVAGFVADDWVQGTVERYLEYDLVLDDGRVERSGPLGLPQGPAYGHFFANLYLDAFDRFVEGGLALDQEAAIAKDMAAWNDGFFTGTIKTPPEPRKTGSPDRLGYCRYVDDFFLLFPSRAEAEAGKERIRAWLGGVGLELSEEKTTIHDATDLDPVVEEMKSRKYTLGKLLDNDETLTGSQRQALYEVVESDYLDVTGADDLAAVANNIGFVVGRLADTPYFDQNREALSNLVIELLFSESFKHSAMGGVLECTLPSIINAGLDARFAEHLRRPETPDFKRVLFLQAVQENGFYEALGPELQACVDELTRHPTFLVRFAAVTCLWANGITEAFSEVRTWVTNEKRPEIRGRLLHLLPSRCDERKLSVLLDICARDRGADAVHGAIVAQRATTEAAGRAIRGVQIRSGPALVEWLYALVRHGGRDALEALDRLASDGRMASLVAAVLRMIGSRAYTLALDGFLDARSVLDLHESLPHLRHEGLRDVLTRDVLLPAVSHVARLETDATTRAELTAIEARLLAADADPDDALTASAASAVPEDLGFLDDLGVSYRAYRDPATGTVDIYETVDAERVTRPGAFADVNAWTSLLHTARDKGFIAYEDGRVLFDGKRGAKRIRVHYRLLPGWRRLADVLRERRLTEAEVAAVTANLARVCAGLEALTGNRHRAPTLTPYSVVVDVSLNVRLINVGSAFCRPRYVSVDRRTHIEDGTATDSLFLGWLSFELLTGQCPLAELKKLSALGGLRRYLTFSPALDAVSLFYRRVLRRLTYEAAEHRMPVRHASVGRLLKEYRQALDHLQALAKAGVPEDVLASLALLHFWSQRLSDTWSNPRLAGIHHDRLMGYSFQRVMEDTAHVASVRSLHLVEEFAGMPDAPAALHRGTEGLLHLLGRVEAMQATHVARTGQTPDLRWNLVLLYLALRLELLALCQAVRATSFEAWKAGEAAGRFRAAAHKARFLLEALGAALEVPPEGQWWLPQLEPLASDLAILLEARTAHTPFTGTGLSGLAAFVTLLCPTDADGAPMTGRLEAVAAWERDVVPHLAVRKPLTPEAYRELGLRHEALLAAASMTRVGGHRRHGSLDENLLPLTARKVPVHVLDAALDVDAGAVLALMDEPIQRSVAKGEPVTYDVVAGTVTAVSALGPYLTELARPAAPTDGVAAAPARPPRRHQFYRVGDFWKLVFDGQEAQSLKALNGFAYLSVLLRHPGQPIDAMRLAAYLQKAPGEPPPVIDESEEGQEDSDHLTVGRLERDIREQRNPDKPSRDVLKERLTDLQERIDRAMKAGDEELAATLEAEQEEQMKVHNQLYDSKGRPRGDRPATEKARSKVTKDLKRAIAHLKELAPAAHRHLKSAVKTGYACTYHPQPDIDWQTGPYG
jgi:hypothetical protein